jgi:hypothetical protein
MLLELEAVCRPKGSTMTATRVELDSLGLVNVPADKLWGRRRSGRWSTSASAMI